MTEPFRTRRFIAVPASERPHRTRRAVRVVVTDGDSVLLFADTDPGVPGSRWWVTPGGGIDPGESPLAALHREVREETGWTIGEPRWLGAYRRYCYMPDYGFWAEKLCNVWLARPILRHGPPSEPGHEARWLPLAGVEALLPEPGMRACFRRARQRLRR